jgi:predicted solute-binding protein
MLTPNVLCVDNLSALPYRLREPAVPANIIDLPPARVSGLLESGFGDAALVPTAFIPRLSGFEMLGSFGIGSRGTVASVLFLSRQPLREVIASALPVYLTPDSSTCIALFRMLCEIHHGRPPAVTPERAMASGCLVIGNEAMLEGHRHDAWPHRVDLGAWWHETTGTPFVFARWMIRDGVHPQARAALQDWLQSGVRLARSEPGLQMLTDRFCKLFPGLSASCARDYYQRLRHDLEPEDLAGQALFLEQLREIGDRPPFLPPLPGGS